MRLKYWHSSLLLSLCVLAVYYPSLHAGYNSVDDLGMINRLINSGPINLHHHFFPHGGGVYYRPLTTLTYFFDRDVWGTIASFMHLENILIHLANSFLVLFLTRRLLALYQSESENIALLATLLFALHPLATESVSWISGRTDLLAGFFLLSAFLLILMSLQKKQSIAICCSGVLLLTAALTKEIAVFILPGLLWCIIIYPQQNLSFLDRLKDRWLHLVVTVAGISGYFVMRSFAMARDSGIKHVVSGLISTTTADGFDLLDKVRIFLKVYGFYFKKLFLPWPLNFGIIEISGWNVLAGVVLACLLIWFFLRADIFGALGLISFCVLSPAILIPFSKMTWTPIAERYLYVSIAFFVPMVALFLAGKGKQRSSVFLRRSQYVLMIILVVFFSTTLHRAWIWQDNERLYTDTVKKSPDFLPAKSELASALIRKGKTEQAEAILVAMQSKSSSSSFLNDDMYLAQSLMVKGELLKARDLLINSLDNPGKKYHELLQILLKINSKRLGKINNPDERMQVQQESLKWLLEQQRVRPNPFTLYRIGKMQLSCGNKDAALEYFRRAYSGSPRDSHYRDAAKKFIQQLH